jgi:Tfp pilus assembly PilM family ATPase
MARYLALDWDAGHILVLAADVGKTGVTLERAFAWPEEQSPDAANADAMGQRLRERLKEANIDAAPLVVAIGRDRLVLKEIRYPAVPLHEEPGIVRFQAVKELSDSDDVVIDYQATDAAEAGERKALAVALKKSQMAAFQTLAKAAGLKLSAVAPRAFGALASLQRWATPAPEPGSAVAVLKVGGQGGEFAIGRGALLAFARAIAGPALASDATLLAEVRRNLAVYAGQAPQNPVRALYVAETGGQLGVADRLRDTLAIPVYGFDPLAGQAAPAGVPSGAFAGAAGLFQFLGRGRELPVNFVKPREPKPPSDPNKRTLVWAAGVAAAVLLGLFIAGWARLAAKDRELAKLTQAKNDYDRELVTLDQDDRRYKAVKEWQDSEVVWLDELYDLTASVPNIDKMRVTHLSANPNTTAGTQGKTGKYAARVEIKGLLTDDRKPLTALTRELDLEGFHRVEAPSVGQNQSGGNRRQFPQQWSTRFDVEKRLDDKEKRPSARYERKFDAKPPPRRPRMDGPGGGFLDMLGGVLP